jgi:DNA-binding MarR family transcriptional regulator
MDALNMSAERFAAVLREWAEVFMRRSMRDFVQLSKHSGLSISQMGALFRLYHGGFCGVSDLGDHLGVTNAAASQMVQRMVQQELLVRAEDPEDRRVKNISLTVKGRELVEESIEARRRWIERLTDTLTVGEQEAIIRALNSLTASARQLESIELTPEPFNPSS